MKTAPTFMKIKPILIVVAFLVIGIGCGALIGPWIGKLSRPTPHAQIIAGNFNDIVKPTGKDIVMFSLSTCPHCRDARQYLKENHISYIEFQVDKSKQALQRFKELNEAGVPVIFTSRYEMRGFTSDDMSKFLALSDVKHS